MRSCRTRARLAPSPMWLAVSLITAACAQFRMPSNVPKGPVTISVSASGFQGSNTVTVHNSLYLAIPYI